MKILLVAPGAVYSTYDCYKYQLEAMHDNKEVEVQGFNYHNTLTFNRVALDKLFAHYSEADKQAVASVRSAREIILDAIVFKPDVVMFVSGTLIPPEVYIELANVRHELNRPFAIAIYFTESPYMNEMQDAFTRYADVLFVNDKYAVDRYDPDHSHYIEYLPHSFNPKVHYSGDNNRIDNKYISDVFFGGTVFKERLDMISSVSWGNTKLKLLGGWQEWGDTEQGKALDRYFVKGKIFNDNSEYAKYYRGTKIALNVHRTRGDIEGESEPLDNYKDAYSIGPRIYEAVACGAFLITDYRKEAEDIFGDTIEFFDGSEDLERKIHYWLDPAHEQERRNKADAARERIQDCTFDDRLENIILPTFREVLQLRRIKNE